ncbi:pilin [Patescibacteria group bacterium]|nr:pilin [Patescibacteria group bacterium]
MSIAKKFAFFIALGVVFLFGVVGQARADVDVLTGDDIPTYCFCYDDISVITPENKGIADKVLSTGLLFCERRLSESEKCTKTDMKKSATTKYTGDCRPFNDQTVCRSAFEKWTADKTARLKGIEGLEKTTGGLIGAILPECVVNPNQTCDDVGIFIIAGLNATSFLFGIIGALVLLMFVYGGFVLILSQGNPEKVKQGTGIMTAAVIGLIIAFGGYLLVRFLGEAIGLGGEFMLNK